MRTLIVDCNNLCHIQRHALGDELSYEGELTGVMWGFFNALLRLAKAWETRRFIFAWDDSPTVRRAIFPDYKRHRDKSPGERAEYDAIARQFYQLRTELLPSLGFRNVFHVPGHEADDVIAAVVSGYEFPEFPVAVSTDKDLYQLLDWCDIYRPLGAKKAETVTAESFAREYGISHRDWIHVKARAGDSSDNIPGVQGIGEKTAIKAVRGELDPKSAKARALGDGQDTIARNLALVSLPHESFPADAIELEYPERLSLDRFISMCERYNFQSFLKPEALAEWREQFNLQDDDG